VSISSTFYARVFHTKVLFLPKTQLKKSTFFGAKILYEKRARKTLMKLTAGLNPIK